MSRVICAFALSESRRAGHPPSQMTGRIRSGQVHNGVSLPSRISVDLVPADEAGLVHALPQTTMPRVTPRLLSTCAIGMTRALHRTHAEQLHSRARRIGQRAEHVEDGVGSPMPLRTGSHVLHGLVIALREQGSRCPFPPAPFRSAQATATGTTPSSSSIRRAPDLEDTERLPCFATGTPPAIRQNAAVVEILNEPTSSPPVPTMSMTAPFGSMCAPFSRMTSAQAVISVMVSAFLRSAVGRSCHFDVGRGAVHHFLHRCTSDGVVQISAVDGLVDCKLNP